MASFYCTLSPVDGDGTQLSVYAKFTGGSDDYTFKRLIDVRITGVGTFEFNPRQSAAGRAHSSARSRGYRRGRHTSGCATSIIGAVTGSYRITPTRVPPQRTAAAVAAAEAARRRLSMSGRMPIRTGRDTARSSTSGRIPTQIGYRFDRSTITGAIRNPIGGKEHE